MSMLKSSVFVGFLLFALFHMSHAACWSGIQKPGMTHCKDTLDNKWHPVGSTWNNKLCQRCTCTAHSMGCCDGWPTSVSGGCSIKYDYETCTYELIHLDKSVPCGAAGK
ncbi:beta-microseminoprotein E1-like [Clarias gariepinus]|uniref:beta-microseminoprotein E1-like n=1 Tax=Clarias gariepinus TaxID=13013 RepID=UPI00234D9EDC|nr:beta-microseminoprotein E1-like [Clarias gariepinus]